MAIPLFPADQIEQIARCLSDARTHAQFTDIFARLGMQAPTANEGPKWHRIRNALTARQNYDRVGNNVGAFIQAVMSPVNFVDQPTERFESIRAALNKILAFSGLNVDSKGQIGSIPKAMTLGEAEKRADELRAKLVQRAVHFEVLAFCKPELLDGNYFHAVLEASKSVADKIRRKSSLVCDGSDLVHRAFCGKMPLLAINTLTTDTERSEQSGFSNLLIGLFGTFRNPTAHAPKVYWQMSEQDALDLLSLVSYIHRRLDAAVRTHHPLASP